MTQHTQGKRPAGVWPVQLILAGLTLWSLYWSAAIGGVMVNLAVLPLPVPDTRVFVSRLPEGLAAAMLFHQSINILAFVLLSLRQRLALWGVIGGMAMPVGLAHPGGAFGRSGRPCLAAHGVRPGPADGTPLPDGPTALSRAFVPI